MKHSIHFVSINLLVRKFLKFQLWVYAISLSGGLLGCTTTPVRLTPVLDRPNMDKIYVEGRALAFSYGEKSSVTVSGSINGSELRLLVQCVSHTERIDVIPEKIRVVGSSIHNQRIILRVYPPANYMTRQRNIQSWALATQAFLGAVEAQQTGHSTAIHNEALRQSAEDHAQINATTEAGLLKAHTIFNNQVVSGMVIVKLLTSNSPTASYTPPSKFYSKFVITVPWVEDEPHKIILTR